MGFASYSSRGLPGPRKAPEPWRPSTAMAKTPGVGGSRQFGQTNNGGYAYGGVQIANTGLGGLQSAGFQTNANGSETPLWQTDGYRGDSYIRGMVGMDAGKAYELETKRGALQGLIGAMGGSYGMSGGMGGGMGGGFMAQGPGGMIAQGSWGNPMQYSGSINPNRQIAPQAAMQQSAMPQMQGRYGGQGTFNDVMMGMNQQSMVDAGRTNRQMQGQYYGNAAAAQNQGVLGGLGLMNQQQQNLGARQNDMFGMANQWGLW